ncbi:MAG: hypothetical protein JXR65_10475 [Bacteroidales bacterium]|nr:hypothetical protein [Bacteroidales bacterium]
MYKKLLLVVIFMLPTYYSFGQTNNDSSLVVSFFKTYEQKGVKQALEYIYKDNIWISASSGISDTITNQLQNVVGQLGNYYGYELIKKAKLGTCYVVYSYLVKYDRQPLRFVFLLYKPNNKWRFQSFNFDGNLGEEMYKTTNVTWDY